MPKALLPAHRYQYLTFYGLITIVAFLILVPSFVSASGGTHIREIALGPGGDAPGGVWAGVYYPEGRKPVPEQEWIIRTGFKKKVFGAKLDEELSSGPDIAVLRSGFFEDWPHLLSQFREPWAFVEPGDIAAIEKTKPLLIIPSGGLYGLSGSEFFRAGLKAYAGSGGIVICFSQQRGEDLSALPVPDGSGSIAGAGWRDDSGPLFRASFIQSIHPSLSGLKKSLPDIETDGFIETYPSDSQILLSRPDGRPTALLYRIGQGWVVVTTMFSEVSYTRGTISTDEKTFVRDLIAWAKAHGDVIEASAGRQIDLKASIVGPVNIETQSVKIMITGPEREGLRYEQMKKLIIPSGEEVQVPLSYTAPADARQGIYHIEYILMDGAGKQDAPMVESSTGWFSIGRTSPATRIKHSPQPLSSFPGRIKAATRTEQAGENAKITLSLSSEAIPKGSGHFFARIAGQEKFFDLSSGKAEVVFDIPVKKALESPVIGIYHSSGRLVLRATAYVFQHGSRGVFPEKPSYSPGDAAKIMVSGLGDGELTIIGLGKVDTQMVVEGRPVEFSLPSEIPPALYPVKWEFRHMDESMEEGEVNIKVDGSNPYFIGSDLTLTRGKSYSARGELRLMSSIKQAMELKTFLKDPEGLVSELDTRNVLITPGENRIPISFSIKPRAAGIYELLYGLFMRLPEGAGMPDRSIAVATGRRLFDIGEAAVLGISTDRPVYYQRTGPVGLSVFVYGHEEAKIDIQNEDRRLYREKVALDGISVMNLSIDSPLPGYQAITATARASGLDSIYRKAFIYGTDLPDLSVNIKTLEINGPSLPIAVVIKNSGSRPSSRTKTEVYEGEGSSRLIGAVDVPPLGPGEEHFAVVRWNIIGKTGDVSVSAVVDRESRIAETSRRNNTDTARVNLPDIVLSISPAKESFDFREPVVLTISAVNISNIRYKAMNLVLQIIDPRGVVEKVERVPIADLPPGKDTKIEHIVSPQATRPGRYTFNAEMSKDRVIAARTAEVNILPTLFLSGDMEGTPNSASPCSPFTMQYSVKSAGNIEPTTVGIEAEIRPHGSDKPAQKFRLSYSQGRKSHTIERLSLPSGRYTISLRAVAANKEHNITKEFVIAEQPLIVSAPVDIVDITEASGTVPRVLVWAGRHEAAVRTALSDTILHHAYDSRGIYYKVVDNVEDFENQAMTGVFNTFVLFEQDSMIARPQWLRERIEKGNGLVIIGDGDRSIATASEFGFKPGTPVPDDMRVISFTKEAGESLSGTVPVSGPIVLMEKKGARPVAVVGDKKVPAIIVDSVGRGRVMIIPFSIIRSGLDTGALPLYGLVIGSLSVSVAPERDDPNGPATGGFVVSASSGPVKAKIVDTLPKGARIVWSDRQGVIKDNTITYELTAEQTPRMFTYIYETENRSQKVSREVFYECNGRFVNMELPNESGKRQLDADERR